MKEKFLISSLLLASVCFTAAAQDGEGAATAAGGDGLSGKKLVSVGIGYPGAIIGDADDSVVKAPTVFAAFDYVVPKRVFGNWLSAGLGAGWTQLGVRKGEYASPYEVTYNFVLLSARLAYHFDTGNDKLGVYLLFANNFNYGIAGVSEDYDGAADYKDNLVWQPAFGFGVKYFFAPVFGLFGETAYSVDTTNDGGPGAFNASLGIALKF